MTDQSMQIAGAALVAFAVLLAVGSALWNRALLTRRSSMEASR